MAFDDARTHLQNQGFDFFAARLLRRRRDRFVERHIRLNQCRELARDQRQIGLADARAKQIAPAVTAFSLALSAVAITSTGFKSRARNCVRTWRSESASMTPLTIFPPASSARKLKAPIASARRHAQDFFNRRLPRDNATAAVFEDAGAARTRVRDHLLLARALVNHRAQAIIDFDELVNTGTPAITAFIAQRATARMKQLRRIIDIEMQQFDDSAASGV